ncbi:homoserine kinase [Neobacillus fumarioli]|uniref:homoserine kinase n=1 Tax=Neobacillus fumarioli TaxID=105229 RepID=UPI00082B2A89|nr:homoserine kinase [Neobacillus fumarioli]
MPLNNRWVIKVPASSANLGPGFDSIGIALDLYLTLEVERSDRWEFHSTSAELKDLPADEQHFIAQVALKTAEKYGKVLSPCKVLVESEIPLGRGLGSSASAILAGIELADIAGRLGLTRKDKLEFATELEGHPDNVGASLYGGLVIGCYQENEVDMLSFHDLPFEAVVAIPKEVLLTKDSRGVLPISLSQSDAIQASSTANLLVAALLSGNWKLAGKMMERDRFHQPYRKPLIPFYSEIENAAKESGAFGVALSGAGPSIICFTEKGQGHKLTQTLQNSFPELTMKCLKIDCSGSQVFEVEEDQLCIKK